MSKKSIEVKTVRKLILEGRNCGKTDQEIYHELSQEYYDKKSLVFLITGTVTVEKKNKYKMYNNFLIGLVALFWIFKILSIFNMVEQPGEIWFFLVFLITFIFVAGYFIYKIATYDGTVYRTCGIITFVFFFMGNIKAKSDLEWIVGAILSIVILFLTFYLLKKMFPNHRIRNFKKDDTGEYILDSNCCC